MIIKNLKLSGFRNLADTDLMPDKEMNILCGENAQGKTNVIEAVWLFTGAKSFRTNKDPEMIQFGRQKATLCITFETQGIEKTAKIEIGLKRKAKINEKKLTLNKLSKIWQMQICFQQYISHFLVRNVMNKWKNAQV